jgi:hypothetical protein
MQWLALYCLIVAVPVGFRVRRLRREQRDRIQAQLDRIAAYHA